MKPTAHLPGVAPKTRSPNFVSFFTKEVQSGEIEKVSFQYNRAIPFHETNKCFNAKQNLNLQRIPLPSFRSFNQIHCVAMKGKHFNHTFFTNIKRLMCTKKENEGEESNRTAEGEEEETDEEEAAIVQFMALKRIAESGNPKAQAELATEYLTGSRCAEKDVLKAIALFEQAAEKGEEKALMQLGEIYYRGVDDIISQNFYKAFQYFEDAAKRGYAPAQGNIGIFYLSGVGVERNLKEASYWLTKASENGNLTARCNLANCYLNGVESEESFRNNRKHAYQKGESNEDEDGEIEPNAQSAQIDKEFFPINKEKAIALFKSVLDEDPFFHVAAYHLGLAYYHGDGVKHDLREAFEYFDDAAENGNMEANHYLALYYESGLLNHEVNINKAKMYYTKAVQGGYPPSLHALGVLFLDDEEKPLRAKGKEYLLRAASLNYAPSIHHVGLLHLTGKNDEFREDHKEAIEWLYRSAELGSEDAMLLIGMCHIKGEGVPKNVEKGISILSNLNIPEGHFLLGGIYELGEEGVEINYEKAFMWYQLADAGEHLDAKYRLGLCYYYGRGVTQDKQQGLTYLHQASNLGHDGAKMAIYKLTSS